MNIESYWYYLQLLNLTRNASEKDVRIAINNKIRMYTKQASNAPTLEKRQEAEKQIETLMIAEKLLLGPEGQIIRQTQKDQSASDSNMQADISVDTGTIAQAIEQFAYTRGRKSQERKGTALCKRATIFYNGVEYIVEELIHKKYQSNQDTKKCCAIQEGLVLFEWYKMFTGTSIEESAKIYLPGRWVQDLISISSNPKTDS